MRRRSTAHHLQAPQVAGPPPTGPRPSREPPGSAVVAEAAAVLGAGAPARFPSCAPGTPRSPAGLPGAGAAPRHAARSARRIPGHSAPRPGAPPAWAHPLTRRTPPHRGAPPEREQSRGGTSQAARGRSSAPLGAARTGAPPQRNTLGPGAASHLEPRRVSGPAAARCFFCLSFCSFLFFQPFLVA